ncbi:MAG: hypothetical protein ONA69_03095 [candidate division KSB1 bacterium]|nr:hypothetical protein [candidate division KSB1 bacterium]MDZ7345757.1 hypothetical protein [candidate division KSB1 bacterium]
MRDMLIYQYFGIDLEVVWNTVSLANSQSTFARDTLESTLMEMFPIPRKALNKPIRFIALKLALKKLFPQILMHLRFAHPFVRFA